MSSILHIEGIFILKNNVVFTCDELILNNHESKVIIQDNAELIVKNKIQMGNGKIVLLDNGKITYLSKKKPIIHSDKCHDDLFKYINHTSIQLFMCLFLIYVNIYIKNNIFYFYSNRDKKKLFKKIKKLFKKIKKLFKKISHFLHQ